MNESSTGSTACRIGADHVSRSFGPVRANSNISLEVAAGTVHAIVGENGAGKSTLMKLLYGLDRPDEGSVLVDGAPVYLTGPRDAIARGIGLVQQELSIIPELSLLENLILGAEPLRAGRIDWKSARESATELAEQVGVNIDWSTSATHTPVAIQQQVEILRLVHAGADVLILDEPTAVLAPAQATELLRLLRRLRDDGRTILFISHKLDEVIEVADHISVLRSGEIVGDFARGDIDREGLTRLIIGDGGVISTTLRRGEPGAVALTVDGLSVHDDRGIQRVFDVDLSVRSSEIVGVAAVAGNGQEELAEAIVGVRRSAGSVQLGARPLTGSVRRRRRAGMAYVSADRKIEGLAVDMTITDNAIAGVELTDLARFGVLVPARVRARVNAVLERAAVRYSSPRNPISALSGGNQQRVVLGRETLRAPLALVASQPTRGVDVRGIGFIHELLRGARAQGAAILLFSEELDELRELSDRIVVLHQGRIVGELGSDATRGEIGALMLGRTQKEVA